jgi:5-methylcytosine-specific restriction endonuclease McrA
MRDLEDKPRRDVFAAQLRSDKVEDLEMARFTDALRGYAFAVHQRNGFKCRYCGLDGTQSVENWLTLSRDHLLPKGHPERENDEYIVTACKFCNTADNRYFDHAPARGLQFDGMTPEELIAQRLVGQRHFGP